MHAYCVRCRAKHEMVDEHQTTIKGRGNRSQAAVVGKCPKCGTKMCKFIKA